MNELLYGGGCVALGILMLLGGCGLVIALISVGLRAFDSILEAFGVLSAFKEFILNRSDFNFWLSHKKD